MPEKDTFGDKLRDKERGEEEQHFAKRDRELLERMRARTEPADEITARGRCPNCGKPLESRTVDDIVLDECVSCRGMWLGHDEIAKVSRREGESFLGRLFRQTPANKTR